MRRRIILVFLITLCLTFVGIAPGLAATTFVVVGTVTDLQGAPLTDALVELIEFGRGTVAAGRTDQMGKVTFSLRQERPSPLVMRTWAIGYRVTESNWFLPQRTPRVDLTVAPMQHLVRGTVADPGGRPITAHLEWVRSDGSVEGQSETASDGSFVFTGTNVSEGMLRVQAVGYRAALLPVPPPGAPVLITLIPRNSTVRGKVAAVQGQTAISGARLQVLSPDGSLVWEGVAERDGRFLMALPFAEGAYRLIAWAPGFLYREESFTISGGSESRIPTVYLERSVGSLGGRVINGVTSSPQAGATVYLDQQGMGILFQTQTDALGRYSFPQVPAQGTYRVRAVTSDGQDASSGWMLLKGGSEHELDLRAVFFPYFSSGPTGSLTGQVVDDAGRPLSGATVTVRCLSQAQGKKSTTDGQGRFRMDVASSQVSGCFVTVEKEGYFSTDQFNPAGADGTVLVPPYQTVQITATLYPRTASVTGIVTGEAGSPIPKATVSLIRVTDAKEWTSTTDARGEFLFSGLESAPALYMLQWRKPGYEMADVAGVTLVRPGVGGGDLLLKLLPQTGTLEVRVQDFGGRPAPLQVVTARGSGMLYRAETDVDGVARLVVPAREGPYAVSAQKGQDVSLRQPADGSLVPLVQVPTGGKTLLVVNAAGRPGVVRGQTLASDGALVRDRRVVLYREGAGEVGITRSDATGTFQFSLLEVVSGERYWLRVGEEENESAALEYGSGLPALFRLEAGTTYSLTVQVP